MWSPDDPLSYDEAVDDGRFFVEKYKKDAQEVLSRCNIHWHPRNLKTNEREPITSCRSKRTGLCKHGFPRSKQLTLKSKVICRGNCRKHDLRVSGRRNHLGCILGRRTDPWLSGTAPSFACIFRCNTNTLPNYRLPLLTSTHDAECKAAECLLDDSDMKQMIAAAQRAQRNCTGYFTGYIQKRQPVGAFELKQAARNMQYLTESIKHKTNSQQFHQTAVRMLGDLEHRGAVRPATEIFNLAGNYKQNDVLAAEFYTTFHTTTFNGVELLQREEQEIKFKQSIAANESDAPTNVNPIKRKHPDARAKDDTKLSFAAAYGYRPNDSRIYYLCPWEFTKWWHKEKLYNPDQYKNEPPRTQWTVEGRRYKDEIKGNLDAEAPKPGTHYIVIEPQTDAYLPFPDTSECSRIRHAWVLVRNARPTVPKPDNTPLPRAKMPAEKRNRILNIYLRPWVLHGAISSPHVPHLADLGLAVTDVLEARNNRRRLRSKTQLASQCTHDYEKAWNDYRQNHVVSKHAARLIQNFLLTQVPESDEIITEDAEGVIKENWEKCSASWCKKDMINKLLENNTQTNREGGIRTSEKQSFQKVIMKSRQRNDALWGQLHKDIDTDEHDRVSKAGAVNLASKADDNEVSKKKAELVKSKTNEEGKSALHYVGLSKQKANAWFNKLCQSGLEKDLLPTT